MKKLKYKDDFEESKTALIKSIVLEKICDIIDKDGYGFIKDSSSVGALSIISVLISKYDFERTDHGHCIFIKDNKRKGIINIDHLFTSTKTCIESRVNSYAEGI